MKAGNILGLVVLLAAGCGAPTAGTSPSPSPISSTAGPASSPSSTSSSTLGLNSASPQPTPPALADKTFAMLVKFNCRLPAQLIDAADGGTLPGFLDLATGHFISDPAATMTKVPGSWDDWRTVAAPVLRGFTGVTYSRSAGRWLPADWLHVASDGLHYAYPEVPTPNVNLKLHVVDIKANTDRVISSGPIWGILDYRVDGIYVTKTMYYAGESNGGVWRLNPTTGSVLQLVPETATTLFLGGSAAWGSDRPMLPTTLYRYDLATGARTVWLTRPSRYVQFIGADSSGRPLVVVFSTTDSKRELWLLSSPSQGNLIYSGQNGPDAIPVTDPHGVWLGGGAGLWLLPPGGQLINVSAAQLQPLGACQ